MCIFVDCPAFCDGAGGAAAAGAAGRGAGRGRHRGAAALARALVAAPRHVSIASTTTVIVAALFLNS